MKMPGMGNMGSMMKQVQKMQRDMEKLQSELDKREVEATSGGGAVKVIANGKKEIISIEIDKDVVDTEDLEMLQDLVLTAVNEAVRTADKMVTEEMAKITGGMNIPGLM